jgi:hypothetical protein
MDAVVDPVEFAGLPLRSKRAGRTRGQLLQPVANSVVPDGRRPIEVGARRNAIDKPGFEGVDDRPALLLTAGTPIPRP